ncbi:hypothetical protein QQX13_10825 [Demequina sp. SYSU T00068]|uniref:LppM family (lipo)protein n=1 Tax=Demequina lignilytica TaxID=3051663 RepID=UPI00261E15C5|nr:hypothetical protein [Demequina sp. SYSU T00068]MDN4491325.1 hypothetical protein [Demequina sp. SYSU T00068]
MKKLLRGIALSLLAVVALTGCLKIEGSFVLHEDDTIDGTFLIAVQKGIGDSMGMSDEDLLSQMTEDMDAGDLDGATVEPYEDDDWVGQRVVFDSLPIAEASEDDAGLTVVREDGFFVVQGDPLASESEGEDGDLGGLPGAEATMSVTFPGDIVETNGAVEGTTVTWDLLTLDEPMYAKGRATAGFSLPTWAWYAGGGTLLLAALGIVLGVVLSRRRGAAAPYAPAQAAAGTDAAAAGTYAPQTFEPQSFEPAPVEEAAAAPEPAPTEQLPYSPPAPSESWPGAAPPDPAPTEPLPTEESPWAPPQEPDRP